MSSFLSDSAISMGDNNYGDSIKQPIIDREVISIGSSSSEDTRRGAPDNESSSLEKVRASRHIGGALLALAGGCDLLLLPGSLSRLL